MSSPDALRTVLAQARLMVRRAQNNLEHEPALRHSASDYCDQACQLIDHVMRELRQPAEREVANG